MFEKPITTIKEEWLYKSLDKETVKLIKNQTAGVRPLSYDTDNPFAEEVEIVVRGDKKYHLVK